MILGSGDVRLNSTLISGVIYFIPGNKHPKLILNRNYYVINRRMQSKTMWKCAAYGKTSCKSRLHTTGRRVLVNKVAHNHLPILREEDLTDMISQVVYISHM